MNILNPEQILPATALALLVISGWLVAARATYLIYKETIKDNVLYIRELTESIKALK